VAVPQQADEGQSLKLRVLVNGALQDDERTVRVPAPLAGNPVAVGDHLLFPLANGFIYRVSLKRAADVPNDEDRRKHDDPIQGPAWRGQRAQADARCHLTATADGQFLYADGDIQVLRRKWAGDKAESTGGPWEAAGPLGGPAVTLTSESKEWVVAADPFGLAVFDAAKPNTDPVRRWQGAAEGKLPAGAGSKVTVFGERVAWAVGGRAVAVAAPAKDEPDWVFPLPAEVGEVVALAPSGDGLLVTCSAGVVLELSAAGEVRAEAAPTALGPLAVRCATPTSDGAAVLLPLADGTVSRLVVRKR
jgi:hypothetical protein